MVSYYETDIEPPLFGFEPLLIEPINQPMNQTFKRCDSLIEVCDFVLGGLIFVHTIIYLMSSNLYAIKFGLAQTSANSLELA